MRTTRTHFIVVALLGILTLVYLGAGATQTGRIAGRVVDDQTAQPVAFAAVQEVEPGAAAEYGDLIPR